MIIREAVVAVARGHAYIGAEETLYGMLLSTIPTQQSQLSSGSGAGQHPHPGMRLLADLT
jgi:hypothetical protein